MFQAPGLSDVETDRRTAEFLESYEANWRLFDDVVPTLDALASRFRAIWLDRGVRGRGSDSGGQAARIVTLRELVPLI
ncbi:MAG TPA: hypothetical protein VN759_06905 [Pseudolysinimonas sp.]|nr:hypothetical protein [Pseudolysinimonas sp.]